MKKIYTTNINDIRLYDAIRKIVNVVLNMSERCIVEKNKTDEGILMLFFPVTRQIFAI